MLNEYSSIPLSSEVLSRTPAEVVALLLRLLEENHAVREENRLLRHQLSLLQSRIEELEARLKKNFTNSDKPPSSDSPFAPKSETPGKAGSHESVKARASNACGPRRLWSCTRNTVPVAAVFLRNKSPIISIKPLNFRKSKPQYAISYCTGDTANNAGKKTRHISRMNCVPVWPLLLRHGC